MTHVLDTRPSPVQLLSKTFETMQRTGTMKNTHFRVKRMTLAAEARIIKAAEARALRIARNLKRSNAKPAVADRNYGLHLSLRHHRIHVVRPASRAMHLAHAYLKGIAYSRVENPLKLREPVPEAIISAAAENVRKFGSLVFSEVKSKQIRSWMDGGLTVAQIATKEAAEAAA